MRLAVSAEPSKEAVIKWIRNKIEENVKRGVKTSLLVLQNIIPHAVLRPIYWSKPELIHIFIISENPFVSEEFTTIRYGLTELGAIITEITESYGKDERGGEIILADLSILINTFGSKEVYKLILNKLGMLRANGTNLIAIMHPKTHDQKITALFKSIADNIIYIPV